MRAGDLLVAIQMPSGGWFSEMPVRGGAIAGWFRWTVRRSALDDDITPGAVRALLGLWESTHDPRYRTAAERGLGLLLERQLAGGAWPLVARPYWKQWLYRDFEDRPTLNDGATTQAIVTLLTAARVLGREDLLAAARRVVTGSSARNGWRRRPGGRNSTTRTATRRRRGATSASRSHPGSRATPSMPWWR